VDQARPSEKRSAHFVERASIELCQGFSKAEAIC
jgi:hypothetical protein